MQGQKREAVITVKQLTGYQIIHFLYEVALEFQTHKYRYLME